MLRQPEHGFTRGCEMHRLLSDARIRPSRVLRATNTEYLVFTCSWELAIVRDVQPLVRSGTKHQDVLFVSRGNLRL